MAINLTSNYQKFAEANWTFYYGGTNYSIGFYAYAKLNSQSTENNQSKVNLKSTYHLKNTSASITIGSVSTWLHYGQNPKTYQNATFYSGETTIQEFEIVLQHNPDGTSPTQNIGAAWNGSFGGSSGTIAGDIIAPKINLYPTLNPINDFNDNTNPTIKYSTILGFASAIVKAGIHVPSISGSSLNSPFVKYRDVNVSNGSYTFNLDDVNPDTNETYRTGLLRACSSSNELPVTFILRTTASNTNYDSSLSCKMKVVDASPTIAEPTFKELDEAVKTFLGDDDAEKIIQYISNVQISVVPSAKKYSTIQSVIVNGKALVEDNGTYKGTFEDIQTGTFDISVIDTRQNQLSTSRTRTLLEYVPISINSRAFERVNATSSNLKLHDVDITCYSGTINGTQNTPILQYSIDNTNWTTISSSSYTFANNKITIDSTGITLQNVLVYTSAGTLYLRVTDLFTIGLDNKRILKGVPTFQAGEHYLQANGKLKQADENGQNSKEIWELIYPVGSIYLSVGSTSPATLFGGTWEKIEDRVLLGSGTNYTLGNTGGNVDVVSANYIGISGAPYGGLYGGTGQGNYSARCVVVDATHQNTWGSIQTFDSAGMNLMPPYLVINIWKRTA